MQKPELEYFNSLLRNLASKEISLGVEHEFFLTNMSGEHCSLEQSQSFFQILAKKFDWKAQFSSEGYIIKLSRDDPRGYDVIKYEFPPHLLEIALSPQRNLHDLDNKLKTIFKELEEAANLLSLQARHIPYLPLAGNIEIQDLKKLNSIHLNLSTSRERIAMAKQITSNHVIHFPATIASTQIHVGGVNWLECDNFMSNLYSYEPIVYAISANGAQIKDHLTERWEGYFALFQEMKLFGFPKKEIGNYKECLNYIFETLEHESLEGSLISRFQTFRDLQFIKPKYFGSLEFRSSPAQPSSEKIVGLAGLRLAQVLLASKSAVSDFFPISKARNAWLFFLNNTNSLDGHINSYICSTIKTLKTRKMREEKYVDEEFR